MKRKLIWIVPLAVLGIAAFIVIGGEIVMRLWNWLLPPLFGWRVVTFWQALGLLVLCRIRGTPKTFCRTSSGNWWKRTAC